MFDEKCETSYCVECSAENCVYHSTDDTCEAGRIKVGKTDACTSTETHCDTFKMK
ncbi:MAG: DUF1540 domain-containing protein [Clostridia bacterium]|nr:DUF1540 domain-containing protein [Clostridia bacterium]